MYDVFGRLVLHVRKLIKAFSEDEAMKKVGHELDIDMIDRVVAVEVRDIKGNIHKLYVDMPVELEWFNAEEVED